MIISHKHKFAFIHNPKAGGTSMRKAFEKYHDHETVFWHQGWLEAEERVVDLAHLQMDYWGGIVPADYKTIGFVRNPYDRFRSSMAEFQRRYSDEFTIEQTLDMLTPANIRWDWRFIHFCPQHYFFYDYAERSFTQIGKMEHLEEDWERALEWLGLDHEEIPQERPSLKIDMEFTPKVMQLIWDLYHKDFNLFGYTTKTWSTFKTKSYADRIEAIHNPNRHPYLDSDSIAFTPGELIAKNGNRVVLKCV